MSAEGLKPCPLEPTDAMRDAGAQRLVSFEDNSVWPDSWDKLQIAAAKNEAERVWRSMWLAVEGRTAPPPVAGELVKECDWPEGALFTFRDEPGEHDPCYVVMPGGAMIPLNHHAGAGVDIARAKFIINACNSVLSATPVPPAAPSAMREEIAKVIGSFVVYDDRGGPDTETLIDRFPGLNMEAQEAKLYELVDRILALTEARVTALAGALEKCKLTFEFYVVQHKAKASVEGDQKAAANQAMVDVCAEALSTIKESK